jgi:hypothetical protein
MLSFRLFRNAAALLALTFATAGLSTPASAQATEEHWNLLNRIFEASNSVSRETARQAHGLCVELGKEAAARSDMTPAQHLYFQAEVESCLSYAMNNGEFSDENGSACSHHFEMASLFAQSIVAAQGQPGVVQDQLTNLRDRLQRASEIGPQIGCGGDYAALLASLPATDTIASTREAGIPDDQIMEQIFNATSAIEATQSEDWVRMCRSFEDGVAQRETLHDVERAYFGAMIENCIATAMDRGSYSDESGDACVHHHAFASKLLEALLFDQGMSFFSDDYREYVKEELKVAIRQGPGMGCTQDYEGLRLE